MNTLTIGSLVQGFFIDYLPQQKGLRESTIRSYRDTLKLFIKWISGHLKINVSCLTLEDFTFESVLQFLQHIEDNRHNSISTRNQRLAALHTFFEYMGRQSPEMLRVNEKVSAIPIKRTPPPETRFLSHEEIQLLFSKIPNNTRCGMRDKTLLLFLYNTGARVQEVADVRIEHLRLDNSPGVRLHGKGGKWRSCPLWKETASAIKALINSERIKTSTGHLFRSSKGDPLTRHGIYKRVRKYALMIEDDGAESAVRITPHVFRHSTAVHLLESGVEVNVIRGWLGHVSLETTNRYAEITEKTKMEALTLCDPLQVEESHFRPNKWHGESHLIDWLSSL